MTADPRGALADLVAAFERHLEASASKRGEDDPTVIAAYDDLATKADFLKVVVYNNCGGERYAHFLDNIGSTVFRDAAIARRAPGESSTRTRLRAMSTRSSRVRFEPERRSLFTA